MKHPLHRSLFVIALVGLAGCGARSELIADQAPADARVCASPWVVFSLHRNVPGGSDTFQLFARRADGTDGHVVAIDHASMYASGAPDGSSMLFTDFGAEHLFLYRFADRSVRMLDAAGHAGHGSISRDGTQVVLGNGTNIVLTPTSGGAARFLVPSSAAPGGSAGYPVFTNDSQSVIYAAVSVMQSIRVDGSGMRTLVGIGGLVDFPNPTLSPDGTRVAAVVTCADEDPQLRIYTLASLPAPCASGTVVTSISQRLSYYDPAWGPNGEIAYSIHGDVFLVREAGGTPRNLTSDLRHDDVDAALWPTWVPGCVEMP